MGVPYHKRDGLDEDMNGNRKKPCSTRDNNDYLIFDNCHEKHGKQVKLQNFHLTDIHCEHSAVISY